MVDLFGLDLVVTREGGISLAWHAYPGDKPDVTQFPTLIGQLRTRHEAIRSAAGRHPAEMTVVFDAGRNSEETTSPTSPGPACATSGRCPPLTARS